MINKMFNGAWVLVLCISACQSGYKIPYPDTLPGDKPLVFLPGIVSRGRDSLDFNAAFSVDGKSFFFSRGRRGKYVIMESRHNGKEWQQPVVSPLFDTSYSNTDPFFSADGSLYFISNRPKDKVDSTDDYDIYSMRREGDGWGNPERLSMNSDSTEYYVSLSQGNNLYFASDRAGNLDLYCSVFKNGQYQQPVRLDALNSMADEHDPLIAPDESYIIFNSSRPGGFGEADLYIARRVNQQWQQPVNMGPSINTSGYEYCSNFSPDHQYLFYSSEYDVKWVSIAVLGRYK